MVEAGAAHQEPDPGLLQKLQAGQDLGAGHGQLHPGIHQNQAPQLRPHLLQGGDEIAYELGPQEIIAPAQPVGAYEDQDFGGGRLRLGTMISQGPAAARVP